VDYGHPSDPNVPALHLFAEVIQDAVDLVHGGGRTTGTLRMKPVEVAAARAWIRDGDVGVLSFNGAWGWLGRNAECVRRAILSAAPGA